jgi:hypothetical protein
MRVCDLSQRKLSFRDCRKERGTLARDRKDAGEAIAAEPFSDPTARRGDELWTWNASEGKRYWSDEYSSFADGSIAS